MTDKKEKRDIQQEVTDRIVAALERGVVPWKKPWRTAGMLPTSVASGKPYRGINVMLLAWAQMLGQYESPYWLTFRQAKAHGGSVRKGEKGTTVVFWKPIEVADETAPKGKKSVLILRYYTVFNLQQTDGVELPPRFVSPLEGREKVEVLPALDAILADYADGPAVVNAKQDRAAYSPTTDTITLPSLEQFDNPGEYAATVLHEVVHSTGHKSRLDRFAVNGEPQHFGSERYAREELVAEIGAAMLAAHSDIQKDDEQTAAYVASWLGALRNDKSLVMRAAQQAQKAVDRVLGTVAEVADKVEAEQAA